MIASPVLWMRWLWHATWFRVLLGIAYSRDTKVVYTWKNLFKKGGAYTGDALLAGSTNDYTTHSPVHSDSADHIHVYEADLFSFVRSACVLWSVLSCSPLMSSAGRFFGFSVLFFCLEWSPVPHLDMVGFFVCEEVSPVTHLPLSGFLSSFSSFSSSHISFF